ncbi:hypothetical protein QYE76_033595 [Lolium multiflorum]|uniref:Transposon protein, putative, CACTA, En/Spm sub-class n=1 Tax=Lolium multiflorum TaxID=4521 RepID=A0AAD8QWF3_LOLMU|nr:hypothetical protein QYE76_033595 [Lolium multiflorum]
MMEDGDEEEDNDDQYRSMFSECDDTTMDDNEEEGGEEQASDDPVDDDLRRAISDARRDCGTDKERLQFDKMLEDHHKLLYPGCEDGHRKLGSILELLKWKAEVGVTDSGFEKLMIILKKLFPRNNELPVSTYEAKKLVCLLGLDVQKIHACINDCILYRGEKYENLNKCPICGALRYKIRKDDPGDVEGEPPRKRVPAKVMWYAPIIPRLKRLFRNKEHAQLLRWHMEERKKDAMLRHPADGRQWRNIGREFPDFAGDGPTVALVGPALCLRLAKNASGVPSMASTARRARRWRSALHWRCGEVLVVDEARRWREELRLLCDSTSGKFMSCPGRKRHAAASPTLSEITPPGCRNFPSRRRRRLDLLGASSSSLRRSCAASASAARARGRRAAQPLPPLSIDLQRSGRRAAAPLELPLSPSPPPPPSCAAASLVRRLGRLR